MLGIRKINGVAIDLYQGDISTFYCDAMVVAAGGQSSGDSPEIAAGKLPAAHLLGLAGPDWQGGANEEQARLLEAYSLSLTQVARLKVRHAAFSGIGSEPGGFPLPVAAGCAMNAVHKFLEKNETNGLKRITFVLTSSESYTAFQNALFETFPDTGL